MALTVVLLTGGSVPAAPVELRLAAEGKALQAVVVGAGASEGTRRAAEDLAAYLTRISGAEFEVRSGDGTSGVAVGVYTDFPTLRHGGAFKPEDPFRRDDYFLRTHSNGAYVLGAGELAVHLAVWDFLHRLGYRLYFLTDTWEVVPDRSNLRLAVEAMERPDFVTRMAPRGAPWSNRELWQRWRLRNRVESSFSLHTGHSYGGIIRANRETFAANPDYYALVDGERRLAGQVDGRGNIKFCIGNSDLRQLVVDHAVRQMQAEPERDSISVDPSDGSNWCECADCAALGTVSDRALTLANDVAKAVNDLGLGPKYVGMYAYNQHSPPPTIDVHPNVVVSVATSFIRGGYTFDELIEGWSASGATLGIRDYHDVFPWSHDLPRKARGGDIEYLRLKIPDYYNEGARFMNSENGDSWGANGLGYWLSPRLLWDIDAAKQIEALIEDFLVNAFGAARDPMHGFYSLLNRDKSVRSNEDLIARLYRNLDAARRATDDPAVHKRLDDLILYTRYLELYHAYRMAQGDQRQEAFENVWRHVYRMKDRMVLSTVAICHRDRFRDKAVSMPEEAAWSVPEDANPWKNGRPFDDEEIAGILAAGVKANEPTELDFEPVEYSQDLVPAVAIGLPETGPGKRPNTFRGLQRVHTWLPEGRRRLELTVTGGLIAHYRDRGNVKFTLHAAEEATLEPVARDASVPPDGKEHRVALTSRYGGLHTLEWTDGHDMTRVTWPDDLPFTVRSAQDAPMRLSGRWSLYFYVPKGTVKVAGFATATAGKLLDGDGREVLAFGDMKQPDYFSVAVPDGQDGTLWKFEHCLGSRMLMTVPPYLAPSAKDLLLPREVVDAETGR